MLLQVSARAPVWAPPGSENGPERTIDLFVGLASPTLAAQLTQEIETATAQGASAVLRVAGRTQTVPGRPGGGEYGGTAMRLRLGRARLVGWSEPGNQAKGGDTS